MSESAQKDFSLLLLRPVRIVFLKNMDDFAAVNEVYEAALPSPKVSSGPARSTRSLPTLVVAYSASKPARSCFQAGKLPNDVIVEIECIASV